MTPFTAPWPDISQKLAVDARATRVTRALQAPLRSLVVKSMRSLKSTRAVAVDLPWGVTFHGVLPEAVSSVIWRLGYYEPTTTHFVINTLKEGDTFVDIGSHFGYFSLLASRLVGPSGRVVAIEAMPSTFAMISENVRHNALANVQLHNCAAYSEETTLEFKDFGVEHSSLNTAFDVRGVLEGTSGGYKSVSVQSHRMDDLLLKAGSPKVRMIKIDAESSEEFVLQGLSRTLAEHQPIVLLELGGSAADDAARLSKILDQLIAAGYAGYRWLDGSLVKMPATRPLPYDNYIFAHAADRTLNSP